MPYVEQWKSNRRHEFINVGQNLYKFAQLDKFVGLVSLKYDWHLAFA